jgi:hypothetical protein
MTDLTFQNKPSAIDQWASVIKGLSDTAKHKRFDDIVAKNRKSEQFPLMFLACATTPEMTPENRLDIYAMVMSSIFGAPSQRVLKALAEIEAGKAVL